MNDDHIINMIGTIQPKMMQPDEGLAGNSIRANSSVVLYDNRDGGVRQFMFRPDSKSGALVDNRPRAPLQAKMQDTEIVQRVSKVPKSTKIKKGKKAAIDKLKKKMKGVKLAGKLNKKQSQRAIEMFRKKGTLDAKLFNRAFHGHKAQDEMLSTATTLAHAATLHSQGNYDAAMDVVELSDMARFPTSFMGHHVPGSQLQHPTSKKTQTYGPASTGHGSFDINRAAYTSAASDPEDAVMRGMEYTVNYGAQPPFAKNSLVTHKDTKGAREAHNLREDFKDIIRGDKGKKPVPADAPWKPGKYSGRSVSPPRKRF